MCNGLKRRGYGIFLCIDAREWDWTRIKMESEISFDKLLRSLEIRLGNLFNKVSEINIFKFEEMAVIYKQLENCPHKKLQIDAPEKLDLENEFSLQDVQTLRLICNHNGRISFCVSKEIFIQYFEDFYYSGDEIIVIEAKTQKPICYLDHEEFALIPIKA